jgi:hypothetical protein
MDIAWRYSSRGRAIESLGCLSVPLFFLARFLLWKRCCNHCYWQRPGRSHCGCRTIIDHKNGCPYPAHLFIDVLAKVGYVENAASIIQTRI